MTKKHFKVIAEAIARLKNWDERKEMALFIGTVCKELNPRFDWMKFNDACNVSGLDKNQNNT